MDIFTVTTFLPFNIREFSFLNQDGDFAFALAVSSWSELIFNNEKPFQIVDFSSECLKPGFSIVRFKIESRLSSDELHSLFKEIISHFGFKFFGLATEDKDANQIWSMYNQEKDLESRAFINKERNTTYQL